MKWVTRKRIHVNRTVTAWLIRRFLDAGAEILFVEPGEVAEVQRREAAIGFDAPGARYPHKDEGGRCSFEPVGDQPGLHRRRARRSRHRGPRRLPLRFALRAPAASRGRPYYELVPR